MELKRRLGIPATRLHGDWQILSPVGPIDHPHCVIDVGAHAGWFFHCWLDWCPKAQIHAFEPYTGVYEKTLQKYGSDSRVTMTNAAVGSEAGDCEFNILSDSDVSNSILEPSRVVWDEIGYHTGDVRKCRVAVVTLDAYAQEKGIDDVYLLKIDVQGFELNVLNGAERMLSRVRHVFVESAVRPLYEGAPRFTQVFEHLTSRGFDLIGMQAWHRGNNVLMEADLLFRKRELHGPVNERIVRVVERVG